MQKHIQLTTTRKFRDFFTVVKVCFVRIRAENQRGEISRGRTECESRSDQGRDRGSCGDARTCRQDD